VGQGLDAPEAGTVPVAAEGAWGDVGPDAGWLVEVAVLQPGGSAFFLRVRGLAGVEGVLAEDVFGRFVAEDGAGDGTDEFCAGGVAVP
jgi:hypothetical protein